MKFVWKVLRNALILGGSFFFANLTGYDTFCYEELKPLIIFMGIYVFAELAHHYNVTASAHRYKKPMTLIF